MPEKIELIFKQVKTKEKTKDLILQFFSEHIIDSGEDYEIYPEGQRIFEMEKVTEKIYGVYQKTFYLSDKRLITVRPNGGIHILEYSQVSRDFFPAWKYPDPNKLWELLDTLKWKSRRGYKFTGPPQVRRFAKTLSPEAREDFQLKPDPFIWQAAICCKCNYEVFEIQTLGELDSEGLLHETEKESLRVELCCKDCGQNILLFDPTLHGYNAVIDEFSHASTTSKQLKHKYHCKCGNEKFQVAISAIYDADPETLASFTSSARNNSYGWFYAFLKCTTCHRLINFIDYECA